MTGALLAILMVYFFSVAWCARRMVNREENAMAKELVSAQKEYERIVSRREDWAQERIGLENETSRIITLYEISKDVTRSQNAVEAFEIFKKRLGDHVVFQECMLVDPLDPQLKFYKSSEDYLVFNLQERGRLLGCLVLKGVAVDQHENIMILGNQFALALRRVQLYEEIENVAITDGLTQLHTRRHILERLREEIARSKARKIPLSLLMIDVDHFKKFNDQYGHLTGDQILRETASLIKQNTREIDITGRYGGEEFCVILPDSDQSGAQLAAERIRHAVEKSTIKAYDTSIKTTVSIGLSTFPNDGLGITELIDKADWALYRAKKLGRNQVCVFGKY